MTSNEGEYKTYLGDGVYAGFDGHYVILFANDPDHPTDKIYLEPVVFGALSNYFHRVWYEQDRENE